MVIEIENRVIFIKDGIETDITDKLISIDILELENSLYSNCEIKLADFNIPYDFAKDKIIHFRIEIDNNSYEFLIDEIEAIGENKTSLLLKSKGALLSEVYSGKVQYFDYSNYKDLIESYLSEFGLTSDTSNLLNVDILNDTEIDLSREDVIKDFLELIGFEVYLKDDTLIFEPLKSISGSDASISFFKDVLDLSTETESNSLIGAVYINCKPEESVFSEPKITLIADPSPQPLSPQSVLTFSEDGTTYKINPITSKLLGYHTPILNERPQYLGLNGSWIEDYKIVEEFNLIEDDALETTSGIKNIIAVAYSESEVPEDGQVAEATFYKNEIGTLKDLTFFSKITDTDLDLGNYIKVDLVQSGLDKAITSNLSGTGTELDPYIYELNLGNKINILEGFPSVTLNTKWQNRYYAKFNHIVTVNAIVVIKLIAFSNKNIFLEISQYEPTICTILQNNDIYINLQYSENRSYIFNPLVFLKEELNKALLQKFSINEFELSYTTLDLKTSPYWTFELIAPINNNFSNYILEDYHAQNDPLAITNHISNDNLVSEILRCTSDDKSSIQFAGNGFIKQFEGGFGIQPLYLTESNNDFEYLQNYNKIVLSNLTTGYIKISYETDVFQAFISPQQKQQKKLIKATYLNQALDFQHEIKADGYYPLPFVYILSLIKDWNIESNIAINKDGLLNGVDSWTADSFGDLKLSLKAYGVYRLSTVGYEDLYITYYANKFEISLNEPNL